MLQRKCPKRNQLPRRVSPRRPGNQADAAAAGIVADVVVGVPRLPFQWWSNRRRLNH